ncbi:hypothetical protein LMG29542_06929 [Paraburkholderia humisilvae]|uniref:Uncharacterized protein n=1 Tax=Paraburkholderia humisilvae TaxID=627669 RepID=A0A6J5F4H6_9BURK|nr:hypothetical protein LMG29542_06929 [Paraburkholderia humisilvae]
MAFQPGRGRHRKAAYRSPTNYFEESSGKLQTKSTRPDMRRLCLGNGPSSQATCSPMPAFRFKTPVTLAGYVANENQRSSPRCHYARENHEKGYHPFQSCCEENGHFESPLLMLFRAKLPVARLTSTDVRRQLTSHPMPRCLALFATDAWFPDWSHRQGIRPSRSLLLSMSPASAATRAQQPGTGRADGRP